MPRRRNATKTTKKTYRRRRRNYKKRRANPKTCINRGPSYLPERYITKLVINDRRSIVLTSGAANYLNYGLNCLYDPYLGVGGPQPNGFDQLITLYAKYRVLSCKYVTYGTTAGSGAGANNIEFAAVASADNSLSTADPQEVASQPYGKMTFQYLGAPPKYLSRYVPMARVFGMPRNAFMINDDYAGSNSANPTEIAYLTICAQAADEATTTTVYCYTRLTFYCVFYDRITKDDA